MAKGKISSDFASFYNSKHETFEKARSGEEEGQGLPFGVGVSGHATLTDVVCDKTKNGKMYVRFDFTVVEPEELQGKTFAKMHVIFDSDNMSAAQRWQVMLDHAEELGLDKEVRHNGDIGDVVEDLLKETRYVEFTCVATKQPKPYDKDTVTTYDPNYAPPQGRKQDKEAPSKPAPETSSQEGEADDDAEYVMYMRGRHKVLSHNDDGTITIKSETNGRERTIDAKLVEEA